MATRSPSSTAAASSSPAPSPRWARESVFISGLRVTDAETRDAALMVLAGRVNKSLVAALGTQAGQAAMGLSGGDGHVFRARKKKTTP